MMKPNPLILPLLAICLSACLAPTEMPGAVRMELQSTTESGVVYRLVNAEIEFAGPEVISVMSEPDAETLERDLLPGVYDLTLEEDWVLQRDAGEGFVGVEAVLLTPNPQSLVIVAGEVTEATLRFGVGDGFIEFGHGRARIGIDVEESPPYGGTVTFEFEGVVTSSDRPEWAVVGDVLTGTYAFDIGAPDDRDEPTWTSYRFSRQPEQFNLHAEVGALVLDSANVDAPVSTSAIGIRDGHELFDGSLSDRYQMSAVNLSVAGAPGHRATQILLRLQTTENPAAIESVALPLDPPDVSAFAGGERSVALWFKDESVDSLFGGLSAIHAELTSLRRIEVPVSPGRGR